MNYQEITKIYEDKIKYLEIENIKFNHIKSEFEKQLSFYQSELNTYQKRCEQYATAYEQLQRQVKELLRYRFGKKSERFIDEDSYPKQMSLFENIHTVEEKQENLSDLIQEDNSESNVEVVTYQRNKKQKSQHKNKDLPKRVEIISVSEEDKQCPCGCIKTVIRYETKELLHYNPAIFELIEQKREVVACPKGCDGQIKTAPAPLHVLPKAKASEAFLAFLTVSKLEDRQPLYHLEKQLASRYHIDCSRQTMARWSIELMPVLQPIYNLFKDELISYNVSSCDATTLQVLKEPGRKAETKSYVYCMRGGPPDKRVILYDYNHTEHQQFISDWFAGYQGFLHVDGDNFFNLVGEQAGVHRVYCNSHARRKYEPIAQSAKGKGLAKEALRFYKRLYKVERQAKEQNMTPEQRYTLRQCESKPILDEFKSWLDKAFPTVLPKSPLGVAMNYVLKRWEGLIRFLEDGRLEIDNNLTEQEIKPFVMARKNFLFAATMDGAKALCMHFSIIRTARLHHLDPYHYYVALLKRLPHCKSVEDYEALLPWNIKL